MAWYWIVLIIILSPILLFGLGIFQLFFSGVLNLWKGDIVKNVKKLQSEVSKEVRDENVVLQLICYEVGVSDWTDFPKKNFVVCVKSVNSRDQREKNFRKYREALEYFEKLKARYELKGVELKKTKGGE